MSDERVPDQLQSLWQDQPAQATAMSHDELRQRSQWLTRRVSRRNLREYVAGAMALVVCGYLAWKVPLPLMRVGFVTSVPALVFIIYHLHRYGSARAMPTDMGLTSCLQFYRGELERQHTHDDVKQPADHKPKALKSLEPRIGGGVPGLMYSGFPGLFGGI